MAGCAVTVVVASVKPSALAVNLILPASLLTCTMTCARPLNALRDQSDATGGQLNLFDGVNTLTGNLSWLTINLLSNGQGGVADSLSVNVTGMTYTGANADLRALAIDGNANLNLTFQFSGAAPTMTSLFNGTTTASFSGSASAAPEPSTQALLLLPVIFMALRRWRKRSLTF